MRYDSETWKRRPDVFKIFEPLFILAAKISVDTFFGFW